jgi:glycolate oxidase
MLRTIRSISEKYQIKIANVFHAGDGNLHPILLFDERDSEQVKKVLDASTEILDACLSMGGSVTGEHGIGVEKISFMPKLFSPADLGMFARLRKAFNPEGLCSPGKMLPTAGACNEAGHVHTDGAHAPTKPGRRAAL